MWWEFFSGAWYKIFRMGIIWTKTKHHLLQSFLKIHSETIPIFAQISDVKRYSTRSCTNQLVNVCSGENETFHVLVFVKKKIQQQRGLIFVQCLAYCVVQFGVVNFECRCCLRRTWGCTCKQENYPVEISTKRNNSHWYILQLLPGSSKVTKRWGQWRGPNLVAEMIFVFAQFLCSVGASEEVRI